jgi:predicted nucleic acid-binding protein
MAVVLDASVLAEFLIGSQVGVRAVDHAAVHAGDLHVPQLAVIETASVLRAWVRRGEVPERRASAALDDLRDLPARRWPVEPLLERVWELRENITAYDANYVALAEALDAELVTADRRLARGVDGIATCRIVALSS